MIVLYLINFSIYLKTLKIVYYKMDEIHNMETPSSTSYNNSENGLLIIQIIF